MPRTSAIPLYLAKSLDELNNKSNIDLNSDAKNVVKSASTIFKKAEKCREDGDEERSYIFYLRYIESVMYARKFSAPKDKKFIETMINKKDVKAAAEWAEKLSVGLEKRYNMLKNEDEAMEKLKQLSLQNEKNVCIDNGDTDSEQSAASSIKLETSEFNDFKFKETGFIDSDDLYRLLIDKSKTLLIMDVRSSDEFASSHLTSAYCINIPEDIIKPGITAPKLRNQLPLESVKLWDQRGEVDFIFLLDWYSSNKTVATEIKSLKDAIYKWDMTTKLKNEPVIVNGGYDNLLAVYPTMTTNSKVDRPRSLSSVSPTLLTLNIDYPSDDFDKAFIMSTDDEISSLESSAASTSAADEASKQNAAKYIPNIDRSTKPHQNFASIHLDKDAMISTRNPKPEIQWNDVTPKFQSDIPSINRNLKPRTDTQNSTKMEKIANERLEMWDSMSKYEKYTNGVLHLEKERLASEQELMDLRLRIKKEVEENLKLDLQKQESDLLNKISGMEEVQRKQELENKEVMNENENLKKRIDELTRQNDDECQRLKDELVKNQKKELERRIVEKEVQKLRVERIKAEKALENAIKSEKVKENASKFDKAKENGIKSDKQEYVASTQVNEKSDSLSSVIRGPLKPTTNLGPQVAPSKSTNYIKLKDTELNSSLNRSGKLSRAHSFHNISQISNSDDSISSNNISKGRNDQRVIPRIDRKIKPSTTELSGTLNRNFMPVFGGMGPALTGLRNLGNTCYMNSVMQCLANTAPLVNYFRNGEYRNDINRRGKLKGILVDEFAAIIQALYLGQYRSISPRDFRNVISQYDRTFESCEQQDPQEFLNCVIDNLHEDLKEINSNQARETTQLIKSLEDSTLPDDVIAARSWEMYKMLHNSVITEMFQGQYRSTLQCLHCNKKAVKFDTFMFLSLPIPLGVNRCTLKDCLKLFLKKEKLSGASKWKCPKCNDLREAIKKIDIWKLPPVLLVHFKRFYYEGMWKGKMQTYIDFPVSEGLDLQSYVKGSDSRNNFNLYAVTNHSGTLDGGHCIAYCKNSQNDSWYKFDDQNVYEMSESDVKSSGAYILYYITR